MTIYCIFFDGGRIFGFEYFMPGAALYQRRKMGQGGKVCLYQTGHMEQVGKVAIMLLLTAGAMYGSMTMVMLSKMLWSIVEESKNGIGKTFGYLKSFVKIFTIRDEDSMLLYCEEYLSSPALQTLKEAIKGCDIK